MWGASGASVSGGFAWSEQNQKMCFYYQECKITGAGLFIGGGGAIGLQQGPTTSGTQQQAGYCIMGGKGPAANVQLMIDQDNNISGAKGTGGPGVGGGSGYIECRTTFKCW